MFVWCIFNIIPIVRDIQDLTSQVSDETDPVSLLPKVVSLLYVQVSFAVIELYVHQ